MTVIQKILSHTNAAGLKVGHVYHVTRAESGVGAEQTAYFSGGGPGAKSVHVPELNVEFGIRSGSLEVLPGPAL